MDHRLPGAGSTVSTLNTQYPISTPSNATIRRTPSHMDRTRAGPHRGRTKYHSNPTRSFSLARGGGTSPRSRTSGLGPPHPSPATHLMAGPRVRGAWSAGPAVASTAPLPLRPGSAAHATSSCR